MGTRSFDIVGIGFGPANLALAVAIAEYNVDADGPVTAAFVEARDRFVWYPDMLLDGAKMQVAFPKDLVTLRNPTSSYSFFNYLHDRARLADFVNQQTFFPVRREFADYLAWAQRRVAADVRYGAAAVTVQPTGDGAELMIEVATGERLIARNVVAGLGMRPILPEGVRESARQFHNRDLLSRLADLPPRRHQRLAVIGGGQSAAECTKHLHTAYPDAEVHTVISRYGYLPADDSPFVNRIFDPQAVDEFHVAPDAERRRLLQAHRATNYSAVESDLLQVLYDTEYSERVSGNRRLFLRRASAVESVTEDANCVHLVIRDRMTGVSDELDCDAVVFATGFRPIELRPLFGDLIAGYRDDGLAATVDRDYRVPTADGVTAGIYVQGGTEHTHGLSSSLLSNVAVRAGDILGSVLRHRAAIGEPANR